MLWLTHVDQCLFHFPCCCCHIVCHPIVRSNSSSYATKSFPFHFHCDILITFETFPVPNEWKWICFKRDIYLQVDIKTFKNNNYFCLQNCHDKLINILLLSVMLPITRSCGIYYIKEILNILPVLAVSHINIWQDDIL